MGIPASHNRWLVYCIRSVWCFFVCEWFAIFVHHVRIHRWNWIQYDLHSWWVSIMLSIWIHLIGRFVAAVITVGYYFERWRALATGIAMCGSGAGTFVMAPFCEFLIKEFGWQGALQWLALIILLCVICGAMFRPLESVQITLSEEEQEANLKSAEKPKLPVVFTKPLAEGRYAFSVPNSSHNTWIGASSNTRYPTAAEVFRGSGANLDRRTSITPSATPTVTTATTQLNAGNIHHTTKKLEQLSKAQQKRSGNATPTEEVAPQPAFNLHKELNTVGEDDENESEALIDQDGSKPQLTARRHTVSGRRPNIPTNGVAKKERTRNTAHQHFGSSNRPLYRDDIFFSGSLVRIPGYQSQTSLQYHMTVTRMPTQNDVDEVTIAFIQSNSAILFYKVIELELIFYFRRRALRVRSARKQFAAHWPLCWICPCWNRRRSCCWPSADSFAWWDSLCPSFTWRPEQHWVEWMRAKPPFSYQPLVFRIQSLVSCAVSLAHWKMWMRICWAT